MQVTLPSDSKKEEEYQWPTSADIDAIDGHPTPTPPPPPSAHSNNKSNPWTQYPHSYILDLIWPYIRLGRLDSYPIGTVVLFWPTGEFPYRTWLFSANSEMTIIVNFYSMGNYDDGYDVVDDMDASSLSIVYLLVRM